MWTNPSKIGCSKSVHMEQCLLFWSHNSLKSLMVSSHNKGSLIYIFSGKYTFCNPVQIDLFRATTTSIVIVLLLKAHLQFAITFFSSLIMNKISFFEIPERYCVTYVRLHVCVQLFVHKYISSIYICINV